MFRYLPTGDGLVTVASDDPFLSENVDMTLNEHSDNVMVLTALLHKTGKPLIVETVTVMDNLRRVRTVQVCMCVCVSATPCWWRGRQCCGATPVSIVTVRTLSLFSLVWRPLTALRRQRPVPVHVPHSREPGH